MNPLRFKQAMDYLTRIKKVKPDLPDVFPASQAPIPPKKESLETMEAINRFVRDNPRQDMAGGGMLVQPGFGGTRQGYREDKLSKVEQKKIMDAFPETKFNFDKFKYGVKKYLTSDRNKANKDYTKIQRFINKGFKLGKGEGLTTRGTVPKDRGAKLSLKDQEKIKSLFELPEGLNDWDFKNYKYGIKPDGVYENFIRRIDRRLKDKTPWKIAADRGSTKGWMLLQMNRVFENEKKRGVKNPTYQPVYKEINGIKRIIGFKDNTVAGGGNYYYGLDKYSKKNATDITQHGDFKLNQKLVDISKRSFNQPNEVITGLLKQKGFTDKVRLNDLIQYLSGTPGNSKDALLNAVTRHHQSGVKFGSATDDLALTTRTINNTIKGIESRIANNIIKPEDIEVLKNNNVFVRSPGGKLYGAGAKTPIGQFKQIEKGVETAIRSPDFNVKGLSTFMKDLGIKCRLANGINCNMPQAYQKSIDELTQKAKQGDGAARAKLTNFTNKAATAGRVLKGALGPLAIASELAIEGGIALNKTLQTGVPLKTAFADSIFNLALGPKLQIDKEAELEKEFAKGEDFAMAERGRRMMIPQSATADAQRLKKREQQMEEAFPTTSISDIQTGLNLAGMTQQDTGMTFPQLQDFLKQQDQTQAIADAGGVANLAGGGIAKLAGVDSGPPPVSGPNSQGLQGLMKRVKKL
jgi:hypothetical protein